MSASRGKSFYKRRSEFKQVKVQVKRLHVVHSS